MVGVVGGGILDWVVVFVISTGEPAAYGRWTYDDVCMDFMNM